MLTQAVAAVVLLSGAAVFTHYAVRGAGWRPYPYSDGFPEINSAGPIASWATGLVAVAKMLDSLHPQSERSLINANAVMYWDYLVTCPVLILDLAYTLKLQYRWFLTGLTWVCILMAVLSSTVEGFERWTYFGIGCTGFLALFLLLIQRSAVAFRAMPPVVRRDAAMGLFFLFVFWPMFPLLFVLSDRGFGMLSDRWVVFCHAPLDVICKTVFSTFILRARLNWEEYDSLLVRGVVLEDMSAEEVRRAIAREKVLCRAGMSIKQCNRMHMAYYEDQRPKIYKTLLDRATGGDAEAPEVPSSPAISTGPTVMAGSWVLADTAPVRRQHIAPEYAASLTQRSGADDDLPPLVEKLNPVLRLRVKSALRGPRHPSAQPVDGPPSIAQPRTPPVVAMTPRQSTPPRERSADPQPGVHGLARAVPPAAGISRQRPPRTMVDASRSVHK